MPSVSEELRGGFALRACLSLLCAQPNEQLSASRAGSDTGCDWSFPTAAPAHGTFCPWVRGALSGLTRGAGLGCWAAPGWVCPEQEECPAGARRMSSSTLCRGLEPAPGAGCAACGVVLQWAVSMGHPEQGYFFMLDGSI